MAETAREDRPLPTTIANERTKLTATLVNTAAGAALAVGVFGPIAAVTFGFNGVAPPTIGGFVVTVGAWLIGAFSLHLSARFALRDLKP